MEGGLALGREQLNDTRRRLGLGPRPQFHGGLSPELCLVATFPQLEYPRDWPDSVHVVGPLLWEPETAAVPIPAGDGPLVIIAPSTAQDPGQRMLRAALAGLGGIDARHPISGEAGPVRLLAATNRRPVAHAVRAPENTTLVDWLSYRQAMPEADLVVLHAGHGTLVRALASGTPVLAIPHVGDMAENAARVDWAGAGLRMPWHLLSPLTLRLAVQRALDPATGLSSKAVGFRAWSATHDGAARAADLIERLR